MTIKLLPTNYWHVRWNANLWVQWPCYRGPTMSDAFGWVTEDMLDEAFEAAVRYERQL